VDRVVRGGAVTVVVDEQSSVISMVFRMSELFLVVRTRHGVRELRMHGDSWTRVGWGVPAAGRG
jgi:hypothetical protein